MEETGLRTPERELVQLINKEEDGEKCIEIMEVLRNSRSHHSKSPRRTKNLSPNANYHTIEEPGSSRSQRDCCQGERAPSTSTKQQSTVVIEVRSLTTVMSRSRRVRGKGAQYCKKKNRVFLGGTRDPTEKATVRSLVMEESPGLR